jgi:hypothetical protein
MAVPAFAPGKELAVLGHGDGEVTSARRHRPPDSRSNVSSHWLSTLPLPALTHRLSDRKS